MSDLSRDAIEVSLKNIVDPHTSKDIVSSKLVKAIRADGKRAEISIMFSYPAAGWHADLRAEIETAIRSLDSEAEVSVEFDTEVTAHSAQKGVQAVKGSRTLSRSPPAREVSASRRCR